MFSKKYSEKYSRREFLKKAFLKSGSIMLAPLPFLSCKNKSYQRPNTRMKLGAISDFLYKKVYLQKNQILVTRFDDGWGALSTTCSKDGCDLSFDNQYFFCPCCSSIFSHLGHVRRGPAVKNLSWVSLKIEGNAFFVQTGEQVSPAKHITSEEIEKVILEKKFQFKEVDDINETGVKLPSIFFEE